MAKIVVLGAGLVGGVMAVDLAKQHKVTSVDISQKNLDKLSGINTICADISDTTTLQELIKDFDLIVGAVPGFMGYQMMKNVISLKDSSEIDSLNIIDMDELRKNIDLWAEGKIIGDQTFFVLLIIDNLIKSI